MIYFFKSHPVQQAMSARPITQAELLDAAARSYRNPGEPSADQAAAGAYKKPTIEWRGLTLAIENPAGSVRRGVNRSGQSWEIRMTYDYGEVVGSMGVDGDPVDIYMGPNPDAPMVYVVHQNTYGNWTKYDEDKCMLGFDSQADAEQAFLTNYTDKRFLGPVTAMPVDEFVAKVRATREKPAMIKAILFLKTHVDTYTRKDGAVVAAHEDKRHAARNASPNHGREWNSTAAVAEIERYMDEDEDYADFGLRIIPPGHEVKHGDVLPESKRWEDGTDTGEELGGTSTIGISSKGRIKRAISDLMGAGYQGSQIALVKGESKGSGEDIGEVIIKDASVVATWSIPRMQKSNQPIILFIKSHVGAYLRDGKMVNLNGYQGRSARAVKQAGQMSLFGGPESGKPLPPSPLQGKDAVKHTPDMFEDERIGANAGLHDGTTIRDGKGKHYRVHYMRNSLVIAHPIVDGKAQVNADSTVRFWTNPDQPPAGDSDRTDPIYVARAR